MSLSFFSSSQLPPAKWEQTLIDGIVESTILQFFFTGIYTLIFFQAIVSPFRQRNRIIAASLAVLFIAIVGNLMAVWQMFRSIAVTHNATRNDMVQDILTTGSSHAQKAAIGTLALAVLVSDALLAWRCYILWERNKWMLIGYSVVFFGELTALPVCIALNITMGTHWGYLDICFALSLGITVTASVLIIYRVVTVSRQLNNNINPYHYTIKILVESGILYTANILICGLLLILQSSGIYNPGSIRATYDFNAILAPVTGIAPTLITARNAKVRINRSDLEHSQTISQMRFEESEPKVESMFIDDTNPPTSTIRNKKWQARSV